jgi:hypothetical protein
MQFLYIRTGIVGRITTAGKKKVHPLADRSRGLPSVKSPGAGSETMQVQGETKVKGDAKRDTIGKDKKTELREKRAKSGRIARSNRPAFPQWWRGTGFPANPTGRPAIDRPRPEDSGNLAHFFRAIRANNVGMEPTLNPAFSYKPGKMLEGAIISSFGVFRETAAGQLPALQVVLKAVATGPLVGARIIAAVAMFQILFLFAFHTFAL